MAHKYIFLLFIYIGFSFYSCNNNEDCPIIIDDVLIGDRWDVIFTQRIQKDNQLISEISVGGEMNLFSNNKGKLDLTSQLLDLRYQIFNNENYLSLTTIGGDELVGESKTTSRLYNIIITDTKSLTLVNNFFAIDINGQNIMYTYEYNLSK